MAFLIQRIKAYHDRWTACYRLAGLLMVAFATTNNRWPRLLFSEIKRQISDLDNYEQQLKELNAAAQLKLKAPRDLSEVSEKEKVGISGKIVVKCTTSSGEKVLYPNRFSNQIYYREEYPL